MSATLFDAAPLAAPSTRTAAATSTAARRTGLALTTIAVLFLAVDAIFKFVVTPEALAGTTQLGWSTHHMPILGAIELACLALYLAPRTAPLGAVLWTGYLGGAIATHLRIDNPLLTHVLFPIYVAAFVWGGLYLRDARVRALLGARR